MRMGEPINLKAILKAHTWKSFNKRNPSRKVYFIALSSRQVLRSPSLCNVILPSVAFSFTCLLLGVYMFTKYCRTEQSRIRMRGRGSREGAKCCFPFYLWIQNFKTKYFENCLSKLWTVFTFELLASRSLKLGSLLIGFKVLILYFQN
jgi:hypothetical protein